MEKWKDVAEYPELFMVSDAGRVFSKRSNKILKQTKTATGYLVISTIVGGRKGKYLTRKVHRWVAEAFIENPHGKPSVNHIDGDKTNNVAENLEWVTHSENTKHAYQKNLITIRKGENSASAKLTNSDVIFIRDNFKPRCRENGARALGRKFGVSYRQIMRIVRRENFVDV